MAHANPSTELVAAVEDGRPCLHLDDGTTWTYGDLRSRTSALAAALAHRDGLRPGDRVVVQVDKSADAVAAYLACLRLGVVFVPLNVAYTAAEVAAFVDDAGASLAVLRPGDAATAAALDGRCAVSTLGTRGDGTLAEAAARAGTPPPVVARAPDDPAAMLYTSGTTGRSKGAVLSCRNLVANAEALVEAWGFRADDVLLHVLPTFHVHGLFVALHCALAVGARIRFHDRFDVDRVLEDLPRSTVLMGVPTHHHRLLADPRLDRDRCARLRLVTSGSAPLPAHEHEAFAERTGHRIVERYGMTETMILTSNPLTPPEARVAGTVGFPLPGVELRVVDEAGDPVDPGTVGGVEVRSPGVMLGYHGRPDATAEATTPDGWFRTGDLGAVDDEGRLTLAGRSSDLVITGGLNVYPKEVEAALDLVPGVDESAVVGVPDDDFGEAVVAFVVPDGSVPGGPSEDALRVGCADLARFKHPRRFVVVDALPRNAMGKVTKAELRRRLA